MATRTKRQIAADAPAAPISIEYDQKTGQPTAEYMAGLVDRVDKFLFSAELAEQAIQRWEAIHDFALTATHPGAFARVRMVDLSDGAMMNSLPNSLLERVLSIARDFEQGGDAPVVTDDGTIDLARAKRNVERQSAICDAYCLAGFVEPALIVSEAERTSPVQVPLRAIHPADRQRFFQWCQGQHAEASATAADFPAPRELADGVAAR